MTDSDPIKAARQLLEEAEALASRQSPTSGADRILMHPRLVECVRNLLMHHEGRSHETKRLVMLVVALLDSITHESQKQSIPYWTEIPPGTGSKFRRILRLLRIHVTAMDEQKKPEPQYREPT